MCERQCRAPRGHLTIREAADRVGVHPDTLRKWLRPTSRMYRPDFPLPQVVAGRLAFVAHEVDAWLSRQRRARSVGPVAETSEMLGKPLTGSGGA